MEVQLERGPRRGSASVNNVGDELWVRHFGGNHENLRLRQALYTYSRTEDDKVIFRYRRSRDYQPTSELIICPSDVNGKSHTEVVQLLSCWFMSMIDMSLASNASLPAIVEALNTVQRQIQMDLLADDNNLR